MARATFGKRALPFYLHDGEEVLLTIRPDRGKFMIRNLALVYCLLALILIPLLLPSTFPMFVRLLGARLPLYMVVALIVLAGFVVAYLIMAFSYKKLIFWVTNRRIINRCGIIGYTIRSIPIDIITDVVLHKGPFDTLIDAYDVLLPTVDDSAYRLYYHKSGVNHIPVLSSAAAVNLQKAIFDIREHKEYKAGYIKRYFVP